MDGPSLMSFTVVAIPKLIEEILELAGLEKSDIKLFLLHQATHKMLAQMQERLAVDNSRLPISLSGCGNTVSCTLPILIDQMRRESRIEAGKPNVLVGFGVGWSWAGCVWRPTV